MEVRNCKIESGIEKKQRKGKTHRKRKRKCSSIEITVKGIRKLFKKEKDSNSFAVEGGILSQVTGRTNAT